MKLLHFKLKDQYKSIDAFDYEFRTITDNFDSFSPICFVGLNGSGKSNIIEALSEVFCYLDLFILDYDNTPKWAKISPLSFEIEYILAFTTQTKHIKIECAVNKKPFFFTIHEDGKLKEEIPSQDLLPSRIIGYSSGHNESISYSYLKNQGFYANEVTKIALSERKKENLPHTLSLFMDYEVNSLILITNYLFKHDTNVFKNLIRIEQPTSFEINIKLSAPSKRDVVLTPELDDVINKLKQAAISSTGDFKKEWNLYFIINDSTIEAIQTLFQGPIDFFTSLYKLSLLNSLRLTGSERNFYTSKLKDDSLKERAPVVPKENKVFNIDQLKLQLTIPSIEIDYSGLSDGEHQFIHIFGTIMLFNEPNCLFLLDEPESHFNPNWRSKFIQLANNVLQNNLSEFILSTHSPYVISSAKKEHVLKFSRQEDKVVYFEPTRETFGATFEEILEQLFDIENSISSYSKEYIDNLIVSQDLFKMEEAVSNIANSSVKRFLFQEILRQRKLQGNK
ncbi:MAG: restriction system-associated AAA family ATPase [Sulfuricurvum sp.]|nr:restriction system-associated AAA family ATPase [Sulfuricurvum sp.]